MVDEVSAHKNDKIEHQSEKGSSAVDSLRDVFLNHLNESAKPGRPAESHQSDWLAIPPISQQTDNRSARPLTPTEAKPVDNLPTAAKPGDQGNSSPHEGGLLNTIKMPPRESGLVGGLPLGLEGDFKTTTGDRVEYNKDGGQKLTTSGGQTVEIDKDGNIKYEGVKSVETSKDGKERSVTFDDGTVVRMNASGISRVEHAMPAPGKGDFTLSTGDRLQNDGQKQTLTTPDGTKLVVNNDGSYKVDGKIVSTSADGKTIKLGDGSVVHLENGKITGLERNGKSAQVCGQIPREDWDPRANRSPVNFPHPLPLPMPSPLPYPSPRPDPGIELRPIPRIILD